MSVPVSPELRRFRYSVSNLDYQKRRVHMWHNVKPRMPRFLYKFRTLLPGDDHSIERMRDILVRSRFWLNSPLDFNDPFDMSAKLVAAGTVKEKGKRIKDLLKERNTKFSELRKLLPNLVAKPNNEFATLAQKAHYDMLKSAGVYSFGGDSRSILMWSHYASNHEGICLQFETVRDIETFTQIVRIKYSDDYPVVNWITDFYEGLDKVIATKYSNWSYEREHRILVWDAAHTYLNWRPEALRGVILGCRIKENSIQILKQLLNERASNQLPLPQIYRAFQHDTKYKLVIRKEMIPS